MSFKIPERSGDQFGQRYSALPLWDVVRLAIFDKYQKALDFFREIQYDRICGRPVKPKAVDEFNGYLFALFVEMSPKLRTNKIFKTQEWIMVSKRIDSLLLEDRPSLSQAEARYLFLKMRDALEEVGITKVEIRQIMPGQAGGYGLEGG